MAEREVALVDSHCHLDELVRRGFDADLVIENAHRAGVHQVITSGDALTDSRAACDLADRYREVYFTVGWHPVNPRPPTAVELEAMVDLLSHPKAVAVGEIGLDYFFRPGYLETPAPLQMEIFAEMLELAAGLAKPVVIHQRQAHQDLLKVLDAGPPVNGVLHCFQGGADFAREAVGRGLLCSFAGNLTFKSARDLQEAARELPAESLLVETDAPFLAPEPHRGQSSQPAMVRTTAQWLAVLRGECLETIAESTSASARELFGFPPR